MTETTTAPEDECPDCRGSGFRGGGDSGQTCGCPAGQAREDELRRLIIDRTRHQADTIMAQEGAV